MDPIRVVFGTASDWTHVFERFALGFWHKLAAVRGTASDKAEAKLWLTLSGPRRAAKFLAQKRVVCSRVDLSMLDKMVG